MVRPRHEHPTPAELEVLQILWDRGPASVRQVLDAMAPQRQRAYTSVMSLMNVMAEKGLLKRRRRGRAFIYSPQGDRQHTLGAMVGDLLDRAFAGSTSALVANLLDQANPSAQELDEIRRTIEAHRDEEVEE